MTFDLGEASALILIQKSLWYYLHDYCLSTNKSVVSWTADNGDFILVKACEIKNTSLEPLLDISICFSKCIIFLFKGLAHTWAIAVGWSKVANGQQCNPSAYHLVN